MDRLRTDAERETRCLLSAENDFFAIEEEYWDVGCGDIVDRHGNTIGSMRRNMMAMRESIDVYDRDEAFLFNVERKILSTRQEHAIKIQTPTHRNTVVARIRHPLSALIHGKVELYTVHRDGTGREHEELSMTAQGGVMKWDFTVYDMSTGDICAEIRKADRMRDMIFSGIIDKKDNYTAEVHTGVYRMWILALVIAIDNIYHDNR